MYVNKMLNIKDVHTFSTTFVICALTFSNTANKILASVRNLFWPIHISYISQSWTRLLAIMEQQVIWQPDPRACSAAPLTCHTWLGCSDILGKTSVIAASGHPAHSFTVFLRAEGSRLLPAMQLTPSAASGVMASCHQPGSS